MKEFKLNICGSEYTVKCGSKKELNIPPNVDGETNFYMKEIKVCDDFSDETSYKDMESEEAKCNYLKEVVVHEIAHAYLYENGKVTEGQSEKYAEWFSVNLMKMCNLALEIEDKLGLT